MVLTQFYVPVRDTAKFDNELFSVCNPLGKNGGEDEIRTHDRGLAYARFPGECLQPLGHLSA